MIVFFSVKEATKNAVILNQKIFLTKQNKKRLLMSCKNTGKVLQEDFENGVYNNPSFPLNDFLSWISIAFLL